eukprot:7386561-Prymnesium_polylepis.4
MGELASCTDPSFATKAECLAAGNGAAWINPHRGSFDDFGEAMRLLYVMSTGDEWAALMFTVMDATEPGRAPQRNDFSPAALFCLTWMLLGSFFALHLFVGVVIDEFNRIKAEQDGSATMTVEQQQWVGTLKAVTAQRPLKTFRQPESEGRMALYRLIHLSAFDSFITVVIIANIALMTCDYWGVEEYPVIFFATQEVLPI